MARFNYLERVRVLSQNIDSTGPLFSTVLPLLQSVEMDCAGITSFERMFEAGPKYLLRTVKLTNTNSATDFSRMFSGCRALQSITLDTSNGTDFEYMFNSCSSLRTVTLDTSSGTNFNNMFYDCSSLRTVTLDTSSGTNFNGMFRYCIALQETPTINATGLETADYMFVNCHSLSSFGLTVRFEEDVTGEYAYDSILNNCYLSATSLNQIYTDLPDATGSEYSPLFGVGNNYGVDDPAHDPTIATAKNWTITY